jgi:PilZ domain
MRAPDRRVADRFSLKIPMFLQKWRSVALKEDVESVNLSGSGAYFNTEFVLRTGDVVELTLQMPREVTGVLSTRWRCTGHVIHVRQASAPGEPLGVGVQFDCYEISRFATSNC